MRCKYCFYYDLVQTRQNQNYGMMSEKTLEIMIIKAFKYAEDNITFAFQGGEPTLRGLDFFKQLVTLVKQYNESGINIQYAIQTNGLLLDNKWAEFFSANQFLVGVSLDGNRDIHDMHRIDISGEGTYKRVMNSIRTLRKFNVDFNILCVVTKALARRAARIYTLLKTKGFKYMQFIPCMDKLGQPMGRENYSLSPELYGTFLITLFNEWFEDLMNGEYISIRMFDNILSMLNGYPPEACNMRGGCSRGTVIEANGSVYPCDFYVMDEWKAGNVHSDDFESMIQSETMDRFVDISMQIDPACRECSYFPICRSGCRRYKEPIEDGKPLVNYFCESYKMFYLACLDRLYQAARVVRR